MSPWLVVLILAQVVELAAQALQVWVPGVAAALAVHMPVLVDIPVADLRSHLQYHILSQQRSRLDYTKKTVHSSLEALVAGRIGSSVHDQHTAGTQTSTVLVVRSQWMIGCSLQDLVASVEKQSCLQVLQWPQLLHEMTIVVEDQDPVWSALAKEVLGRMNFAQHPMTLLELCRTVAAALPFHTNIADPSAVLVLTAARSSGC